MKVQRVLVAAVLLASVVSGVVVQVKIAEGAEPYGPPITLAMAKKIMAAAEAEATRNGWEVVIAIVDSGANLVMLHRLDNAQLGSLVLAPGKAKTAADFRRPTKVFETAIAEGGVKLKLLKLNGVPMEGGLPIILDGKIIGAVGVSGVTSAQDAIVAAAGIEALVK